MVRHDNLGHDMSVPYRIQAHKKTCFIAYCGPEWYKPQRTAPRDSRRALPLFLLLVHLAFVLFVVDVGD
jgi:hypothetical protein